MEDIRAKGLENGGNQFKAVLRGLSILNYGFAG